MESLLRLKLVLICIIIYILCVGVLIEFILSLTGIVNINHQQRKMLVLF